ncbi:MAG: hypothetical protein SYR96_23990, partial [Actinomycetota bacterium]|nr:hypothetical protein [Actinomycetota bacterium]
VRIDPNRAMVDLPTAIARVESYVFAPPVPVFVNGERVALETTRLVTEPLLPATETRRFKIADLKQDRGDFIPGLREKEIAVVAIPLDLGRVSACPDVRGQMIAYVPVPPGAPTQPIGGPQMMLDECVSETVVSIREGMATSKQLIEDGEPTLEFIIHQYFDSTKIRRVFRSITGEHPPALLPEHEALFSSETADDLNSALRKAAQGSPLNATVRIPYTEIPLPDLARSNNAASSWAYNGIALPSATDGVSIVFRTDDHAILRGSLHLSGELRPDLAISRAHIRTIPFPLHSAVQFAIRQALRHSADDDGLSSDVTEPASLSSYLTLPPDEDYSSATLHADRLMRTGAWNSEQIIHGKDRRWSVNQLRSAAAEGHFESVSEISYPWKIRGGYFTFYYYITAALLHFFVDLTFIPQSEDRTGTLQVRSADVPSHPVGSLRFPPLFAVNYQADASLLRAGKYLNAKHALTQWLMTHAETLAADFPAPFQGIFRKATDIKEVQKINEALDRVAQTRPDIAPPAEAYLREDENGWWWSRVSAE